MQIQEVIDFPIRDGKFRTTGIENGKPYVFLGLTHKEINRFAEAMRKHYRADHGRKNYKVSVRKNHDTNTMRVWAEA